MRNNIAIAQINPKICDIESNAKKICECIRLSQARDTDLVIFPELALSGYGARDMFSCPDFARKISASIDEIIQFSSKYDTAIIFGTFYYENNVQGNAVYNSALFIVKGRLIKY
ncbi:hypothetical protein MIDIC_50082 [Alphaproteobacteria bacterium]